METAVHGEVLLALGCELAQGYAIAPPMPETELPGWVADWQKTSACLDCGQRAANIREEVLA